MTKTSKKSEETFTISKKDFDLLTSIFPMLSALKQNLEKVVLPKYIEEIDIIKNTVETVFSPFWKKEEEAWDKNFNKLNEIADKNKFKTVWSIEEVSADQLNEKCPSQIKQLNYKGQIITFKSKKISWLDMWKAADQIIRMSEDSHHIFIEHFEKDSKNKDHYNLVTGS